MNSLDKPRGAAKRDVAPSQQAHNKRKNVKQANKNMK